MATKAQIEANRRNARLSTGPRSAAGRETSSGNALRHGLTAEHVVIFDESAEDFARFHWEMRAALAPADAVEEELAERVILCAWRLRRAARAETGLVNDLAEDIRGRSCTDDEAGETSPGLQDAKRILDAAETENGEQHQRSADPHLPIPI